MTHILTPGMDPSQIETGVEGLRVTRINVEDGQAWVDFNRPVDPTRASPSQGFSYTLGGRYVGTWGAPALILRSLDWSKPLVASQSETPARVLASLPDHNLKVVEIKGEVFFAKLSGEVLDSGYRLKNGPVISAARVVVLRDRRVINTTNADAFSSPIHAHIDLTWTDGILTGAEVVTPNREPHA